MDDSGRSRNLTDAEQGILTGKRYLIHDRDPLFSIDFLKTIADSGVKSVKLPPRSPNLNAHAERFVRSIKEGCLDRMIIFGEKSLRTVIQNFVAHYHQERNHQGLGNCLIHPEPDHFGQTGAVQRRERLGGALNYYFRACLTTPLWQEDRSRRAVPWALRGERTTCHRHSHRTAIQPSIFVPLNVRHTPIYKPCRVRFMPAK